MPLDFDFPSPATLGQVVTSPGGSAWAWDGAKWVGISSSVTSGGPFLPISGGALTGPLTLAADPAAALQPVTLQYFSAHAGSGGPFLPISGGQLTGALQVGASYVGVGPPALLIHGTMSGQPGSAVPLVNYSQFSIDNDIQDCVGGGGPGGSNYLYVGATLNAGWSGNRSGLDGFLYVNGTPGANCVSKFVTAVVGWSIANAPDNGHNNSVFGSTFMAALNGPASGWGSAVGCEIDVQCEAGSTATSKEGLKIVLPGADAVHGTVDDTGLVFVNQSGATTGWNTCISFGNSTGQWPAAAAGTLIGTSPTSIGGPYQCNWGIDFNAVTFTGGSFRAPNFQVRQNGGIVFSGTAASVDDLSRHIALDGGAGAYGMNVFSNALRIAAGGGGLVAFDIGGTNAGYIGSDGLHMPTSGAVAASTLSATGAVSGAGFSTYLAAPPAIGGTTPAAGSFAALSASGLFTATQNVAGTPPANLAGGGGAITWNYGGGTAEVDFWNLYNGAGTSFSWYQKGAGATIYNLANLTVTGLAVPNPITGASFVVAAGGPTITTGAGVPAATQPVSSLYLRTGGGAGARLYVSAGGGTWTAVAGV